MSHHYHDGHSFSSGNWSGLKADSTAASTRVLRWLAACVESGLWTVEHYASEAADRLNCWRTR